MTDSPSLHRVLRLAAATAAVALCLASFATAAGAQDLARTEPEAAQELAERYAPIVVLKRQEEPCDSSGEPYGPTAVDIVLDNPEVLLRQVGRRGGVRSITVRADLIAECLRDRRAADHHLGFAADIRRLDRVNNTLHVRHRRGKKS